MKRKKEVDTFNKEFMDYLGSMMEEYIREAFQQGYRMGYAKGVEDSKSE